MSNLIDVELDLLRGNINRMFISRESDEITSMYEFAKLRLDEIYMYKINNLEK